MPHRVTTRLYRVSTPTPAEPAPLSDPVAAEVARTIESVRAELSLDQRSSVYEVHCIERHGAVVLLGHTTEDAAVNTLASRIKALPGVRSVADDVVRLPRGLPEVQQHAVIRSAVAPVYQEPRIPSPQITQIVLGSRVELLSRDGVWCRTRGEDGYIGWIHAGYLEVGSAEWARAWERAENGEPVVSLGAELVDESGRAIARLPWGARAVRFSHKMYALPDGRRGMLGSGELVPVDRLFDWFPPRGDSVTRTARRWLGAPYLWGGVTFGGVDCSGLTQAVLWMHGIALPRDSDLQARVGTLVEPGTRFEHLRSGDLLFFSEESQRITHVAIGLGESAIIHSSLTNGGVALNDVVGDTDFERKLRTMFSHARRVLPD